MGSPSDGVLQKGDVLKKIGNYDCRDLRHIDAMKLFQNAGSNILVVIERLVEYIKVLLGLQDTCFELIPFYNFTEKFLLTKLGIMFNPEMLYHSYHNRPLQEQWRHLSP